MPEEVFLDRLASQREVEAGVETRRLELPLSRNSLFYLFLLFLILLLMLAGQTLWLQLPHHRAYLRLAKANYERIQLLRPFRGIIYDKELEPLVQNRPSFDLLLDTRDLPRQSEEKKRVLEEAALLLKIDFSALEAKILRSSFPEILLLENIPHETLILLEAKIKDLPGFFIEKNIVRDYSATDPAFSHLLGYTGRIEADDLKILEDYTVSDYLGKEGIEKAYEQVLRGNPGRIKREKDALGRSISKEEVTGPQEGKNLMLWLDSDLQQVLATSLQGALKRVGAKKGAAVALDPRSGGVLALVSLPSFDNNLFSQGISQEELEDILQNPSQPLFNRVLSGQYPTGSVIKPFMASAALQEELISPDKLIDVTQGYIEVPHQYNPDIIYRFNDWKAHGWVAMREAIAVSSNVYFYTVGGGFKEQEGLGVERIKKYLTLFGWNNPTGIDLPGEATGFLPDPEWKKEELNEAWFIGNTYHLSIGQGYLRVTPLQVAIATAALANKGQLFQPQVVKAVLDNQKNVLEERGPQIIREGFIAPENLAIVREGMREAVRYGSSVILNQLPVAVASKTGTAQTSRENRYHHWVTLFAPYEDPEIVLTILIEDVEGLQSATLPVASEVLNWWWYNR